jgi:hypothetical protein
MREKPLILSVPVQPRLWLDLAKSVSQPVVLYLNPPKNGSVKK